MIEIRKSYPTDAYTIINLYDKVWKSEFYDVLPNGIIHDRLKNVSNRVLHLTDQINENNRILVAVADGKIVGSIFYTKCLGEIYADAWEIRSIFILPSYQRQGIGTKLLNNSMEEIKRMGYDVIVVDVPLGASSMEFFLKLGGVKKDVVLKKIDGYDVSVNTVLFNINNNSNNEVSSSEWNDLYKELQDNLFLLNNINLEIAVILTSNNNRYMGIGIRNKVCPVEVALANMYLAQDKGISKILILNKESKPVLPCGKCRDLLISLGEEAAEIMFDYGNLKTLTIKELHPYYKDIEKV